jgi:transcriptional regulator with XRE-family HTH domain
METPSTSPASSANSPGKRIRALRQRQGLTLSDLRTRTGLAVSTLSRMEKGHVSLSYDKLMLLSKGLGVDMGQLLDSAPSPSGGLPGPGRRVAQRRGEGQVVDTQCYAQLYLATELLNKKFTPLIGEAKARTMEEFLAEFGDFIRHPGEEFALVLEGEIEFHSELYAPLLLKTGDSVYFDSEMGHAYLKGSDQVCRIVAICAPRGSDDNGMIKTFVTASERHATSNVSEGATSHRLNAKRKRSPRER